MDAYDDKAPGGTGAQENIGEKILHPNDCAAQRARILKWFEQGRPLNTIQARRELDILMPAARVFELRDQGYDIRTVWTRGYTDCGRAHRIALYTLHGCSEHGAAASAAP